jgi:hypothetical protein
MEAPAIIDTQSGNHRSWRRPVRRVLVGCDDMPNPDLLSDSAPPLAACAGSGWPCGPGGGLR